MLLKFFFILILFSFVSGSNNIDNNPSYYDGNDELLEFYQTYGSFKLDHDHNLPLTFLARGYNDDINNKDGFYDHSSFLEVLSGNGIRNRNHNVFIPYAKKLLDKSSDIYETFTATNYIVVKFKDVTKVDLNAFVKKYGFIATENNNIGNYFQYELPGLTKKFFQDPKTAITEWSARTFDFPFVQKIVTALRDDADLEYVHLQTLSPIATDEFETLFNKEEPAFDKQRNLRISHVPTVWKWFKLTGKGVHIAIVDGGIDGTHTEFQDRYKSELLLNFVDEKFDAEKAKNIAGGGHGTKCAGIAAASREAGSCGVGVAYGSTFSNIRILPMNSSGIVTDFMRAKAWSWKRNEIDIYSNSWGKNYNAKKINGKWYRPSSSDKGLPPEVIFALQSNIQHGRNGKGSIYVFAAGNSKYNSGNTNYDGILSQRYSIVVGAVHYSHEGLFVGFHWRAAWYSTIGATVWIVAASGFPTTTVNDQCTSFPGTSASCPFVSGVIALMLEANKDLTYRDIKEILALTAIKIDSKKSSWKYNGAHLHYSEEFGFGLIDAAYAVRYSLLYKYAKYTIPKEIRYTSPTIDVKTKIIDEKGIIKKINVNDWFILEHADVYINIEHKRRGDLQISLKSPLGTVCHLTHPHVNNRDDLKASHEQISGKYLGFYLPSNGFRFGCSHVFREVSKGEWQIRVLDSLIGGNENTAIWNSVQLTLYGHHIQKPMPLFQANGILTVNIKNARNLKDEDPGIGVSDSYIKVKIPDHHLTSWNTKRIHNELNPDYNQEHKFKLTMCPIYIDIEAWDYDTGFRGKDDLIGKARLSLDKIVIGTNEKIWDFSVKLQGKGGIVNLSVMYKADEWTQK